MHDTIFIKIDYFLILDTRAPLSSGQLESYDIESPIELKLEASGRSLETTPEIVSAQSGSRKRTSQDCQDSTPHSLLADTSGCSSPASTYDSSPRKRLFTKSQTTYTPSAPKNAVGRLYFHIPHVIFITK